MKVTIKEPWWGAHTKFGWAKGTWGVGLNKRDIDFAALKDEWIDLAIWKFKMTYRVSARAIKDYATEHKTTHVAKGTVLYVIPSTLIGADDAAKATT